jgi:hypothetical protein
MEINLGKFLSQHLAESHKVVAKYTFGDGVQLNCSLDVINIFFIILVLYISKKKQTLNFW